MIFIQIGRWLFNLIQPFHKRTNIKCKCCGKTQNQPIYWIGNFRMMCQYGCDNTIFYDGSGQTES